MSNHDPHGSLPPWLFLGVLVVAILSLVALITNTPS